jgi:hypothetical protein
MGLGEVKFWAMDLVVQSVFAKLTFLLLEIKYLPV